MGILQMPRRVLIAPVFLYEKRIFRSYLSANPDHVYLLTSKGSYHEETLKVANALEEKIVTDILFLDIRHAKDKVTKMQVDFNNIDDIYAKYTKIIESERSLDPLCEITVDYTGASRESIMATTLLASLYDLNISCVPSETKRGGDYVAERIRQMAEKERADQGRQCIKCQIKRWGKFDEDEKVVLNHLYSRADHYYKSFSDLINEIGRSSRKTVKDEAFKRKWIRVIQSLKDKEMVLTAPSSKRSIGISFSDQGLAIYEGIRQKNGPFSSEEPAIKIEPR